MAKRGPKPKNMTENTENTENEVKLEEKSPEIIENQAEKQEKPVIEQPKKEKPLEDMTTLEAANHFKTNENVIKLWVEHGHLIKNERGMITGRSIKVCRFNNARRFT